MVRLHFTWRTKKRSIFTCRKGSALQQCYPNRASFQADADLDGRILRGLRRVAPEIDIRSAAEAGLAGLADPEVLQIVARSGRIPVSQDRRTMPAHFARHKGIRTQFWSCSATRAIPIATAIEELVLISSASDAEEWIGRLV